MINFKKYNVEVILTCCLTFTSTLVTAGFTSSKLPSSPLPLFGNYQAKGFLSDYAKIKPAVDGKSFVYRNPLLNQIKYKKIMIDPIKIWTKRHVWPRDGSPILDDLANYFRQIIINTIGETYTVVNSTGPEILRLRIAVTDLEPNDPGISLITLVVPFLWLGEASAGAAQGDVGSTPFAGQAVIEMEMLDSQTNLQLAGYIERRVGKKYAWNEGIVSGLSNYMKAFFTWAYTQDAFENWANLLRAELNLVKNVSNQ